MAHFAKMTEDNIVLGTHTVDDTDASTEAVGQAFLESVHGWPANLWKQTSRNTQGGKHYVANPSGGQDELSADQSKAFRKNFAGKGMIYDPARDAFLSAQPYPSWVLNEDSCQYEAPSALPADAGDQEDGTRNRYQWDEGTKSWSKTVLPAQ